MDRLGLLLLGAVLTLIGAVIVQTVIVPRTARRQRREDRREADTRRLGELMSFEYAEAANDFGFSVWWHHYLLWLRSTDADLVDPEKIRDAERMASERQRQLAVVEAQASWLRWAITHGQPASKIADFENAFNQLTVRRFEMRAKTFVKVTDEVTEEALGEVETMRRAYGEEISSVVTQIKRLEEG